MHITKEGSVAAKLGAMRRSLLVGVWLACSLEQCGEESRLKGSCRLRQPYAIVDETAGRSLSDDDRTRVARTRLQLLSD